MLSWKKVSIFGVLVPQNCKNLPIWTTKYRKSDRVCCKSLCFKTSSQHLLAILNEGQQWMIVSQLPSLLVTRPLHPSAPAPAPAHLCRVATIYRRPFCLMDNIHSFPACSLADTRQSPLGKEFSANAHNHPCLCSRMARSKPVWFEMTEVTALELILYSVPVVHFCCLMGNKIHLDVKLTTPIYH